MSKAHMIVLSFLNRKPMYGYQIGQIVEQQRIPSWSGIRLAAIYKSMQTLEKLRYIKGEEEREGNNPPRTVYQITSRGRDYLRQTVIKALGDVNSYSMDWWMALALARHSITKDDLLRMVGIRLDHLKQVVMKKCEADDRFKDLPLEERPLMYEEAMELGRLMIEHESQVLENLREAVLNGKYDHDFKISGAEK